jgi:glycosyltransferase involved in cell wall biosynthesis
VQQQIRSFYQLPTAYLLYVGSIIERKNLLNICKALALLKGSISLPLVVIGKGDAYKRKVEEYLQQQGLQQQVIFLSYQNGKALEGTHFPAIYQMASMLIYPSFFEGFGIPVLEALWSKVPVITSNVSCLPEAGGEGAFYVDPASPQEIATKIQLIVSKTSLVEQQVAKGFQHAQLFSNQNTAANVWAVYLSVLKD